MNEKITICSVYHDLASKNFLNLNRELTEKLNPHTEFEWIAADNTMPDYPEKHKLNCTKFSIIKGINLLNILEVPSWPRNRAITEKNIAGWQHGEALNKAMKHVSSRFAIFLDNNCYIIRPNWITDVINHMKKNNLTFFGPPPDPMRSIHYKYFPNPHQCFFVDFDKVKKEDLDFSPDMEYRDKSRKIRRLITPFAAKITKQTSHKIRKLIKILIINPLKVNTGSDAGRRIYEKFWKHAALKFECALPVIRAPKYYKLLSLFYPDNMSVLPKRKNSFSSSGFKESGLFDAYGAGIEEYMWQGRPFGLHIRGRVSKKYEQSLKMREVLKNFGL